MGLKLFPVDNGGSSGDGGWSIGCDENFMSLFLIGLSLLGFIETSYFSSVLHIYLL